MTATNESSGQRTDLEKMYGDLILDHQREPRNFGCPASCQHTEDGHNPLCGDRVRMAIEYAPHSDGGSSQLSIKKIYFEGQGCSISMASASMLTEELEGMTSANALAAIEDFRNLMKGESGPFHHLQGDVLALSGVRKFPVRIKCALLPWMTTKKLLEGETQHEPISTE